MRRIVARQNDTISRIILHIIIYYYLKTQILLPEVHYFLFIVF